MATPYRDPVTFTARQLPLRTVSCLISVVHASGRTFPLVAPRARLERATYCSGDRQRSPPDPARRRSCPMWHAHDRPCFTADHRPIGHATGTGNPAGAACALKECGNATNGLRGVLPKVQIGRAPFRA